MKKCVFGMWDIIYFRLCGIIDRFSKDVILLDVGFVVYNIKRRCSFIKNFLLDFI